MPLAPSVRRIVAETDVDPAAIEGTGRGGRLTKGDVLAHLEAPARRPGPGARPRPRPPARPPTPSVRPSRDAGSG